MRIIALFVLMAVTATTATTYYVAKTGSDTNPGTEVAPWLTVTKCHDIVVAGDTVLVKAGRYEELTLKFDHNNGTAEAPIVLKAFDGLNTVLHFYVILQRKHYIIDGFTISSDSSDPYQRAFKFDVGADSCVLRNCDITPSCAVWGGVVVHAGHRTGITIENNAIHGWNGYGIYIECAKSRIVHNRIYDNGAYGIHAYSDLNGVDSNEVAYNTIYGNGAAGIVQQGRWNRVHHNLIYHASGGAAIALYSDNVADDDGWNEVYNNTVFCATLTTFGIASSASLQHLSTVRSNIFVVPVGGRIVDLDADSIVALDYNCYYPADGDVSFYWNGANHGPLLEYQTATGQDPHSLGLDPLVVDTAAHDFHLQPGSPCIGAGYGGCDIGAFPFVPESIPDTITPPPDTTDTTPPPDTTNPKKPKKPRGKDGGKSDATIYFQRLDNGQVYDATGRKVDGRVIFDNKRKRIVVK